MTWQLSHLRSYTAVLMFQLSINFHYIFILHSSLLHLTKIFTLSHRQQTTDIKFCLLGRVPGWCATVLCYNTKLVVLMFFKIKRLPITDMNFSCSCYFVSDHYFKWQRLCSWMSLIIQNNVFTDEHCGESFPF